MKTTCHPNEREVERLPLPKQPLSKSERRSKSNAAKVPAPKTEAIASQSGCCSSGFRTLIKAHLP